MEEKLDFLITYFNVPWSMHPSLKSLSTHSSPTTIACYENCLQIKNIVLNYLPKDNAYALVDTPIEEIANANSWLLVGSNYIMEE